MSRFGKLQHCSVGAFECVRGCLCVSVRMNAVEEHVHVSVGPWHSFVLFVVFCFLLISMKQPDAPEEFST